VPSLQACHYRVHGLGPELLQRPSLPNLGRGHCGRKKLLFTGGRCRAYSNTEQPGGELASTGCAKASVACRGWSVGHVKSRPNPKCRSALRSGCLTLHRSPEPRALPEGERISAMLIRPPAAATGGTAGGNHGRLATGRSRLLDRPERNGTTDFRYGHKSRLHT
jgi:hypothetical protein